MPTQSHPVITSLFLRSSDLVNRDYQCKRLSPSLRVKSASTFSAQMISLLAPLFKMHMRVMIIAAGDVEGLGGGGVSQF